MRVNGFHCRKLRSAPRSVEHSFTNRCRAGMKTPRSGFRGGLQGGLQGVFGRSLKRSFFEVNALSLRWRYAKSELSLSGVQMIQRME